MPTSEKQTKGKKTSTSPEGLEENLKKGTAELLVLFLLREREMYINEMTETLAARSGGRLNLSFPYAIIYRLLDIHYIELGESGSRLTAAAASITGPRRRAAPIWRNCCPCWTALWAASIRSCRERRGRSMDRLNRKKHEYLRRVRRSLVCPRRERARLLSTARRAVDAFLEENPEADENDWETGAGKPGGICLRTLVCLYTRGLGTGSKTPHFPDTNSNRDPASLCSRCSSLVTIYQYSARTASGTFCFHSGPPSGWNIETAMIPTLCHASARQRVSIFSYHITCKKVEKYNGPCLYFRNHFVTIIISRSLCLTRIT